ncbi:MAG: site-specific DNA-methyltransferase [Methylococcaceae bacterium]|jgi:DNA modification methylase
MSEQQSLAIEEEVEKVGEYKFEPIKGYPMLYWKGKRPFTGTQYYPAQLKEVHGEAVNGWLNKVFWGDNLQVMSHLLKEYRGKIQLVYIDPPFDSKADYKKKIQLKGQSTTNDQSSFEDKQYTDIWTNDDYLQFMYERLILIRELLATDGSLILHCDQHKVHHLRSILDEIFGIGLDNEKPGFRSEIIWCYGGGGAPKTNYPTKHDTLLWYSKSSKWIFNKQFRPYSEGTMSRGLTAVKGDQYELSDDGAMLNSWWSESEVQKILSPTAYENLKYPTQKPEGLLKRIIKGHSNKGDLVFDCFMGSGTTQSVAMKLGRRFIGADINLGAVQITTKRLLNAVKKLKENNLQSNKEDNQKTPTSHYTGIEVYNVNHYDVFRNPIQAKELLVQALELNPLPRQSSIFDGEKDGWMVKIMQVNRIATRADLNELISSFDWKAFEQRQAANHSKPVEKIQLVCMGHEPELADALKQEAMPYKIDVEVLDILRNKQQLQFKRDSEAKIIIENNQLVIEKFYPMNLLEKLSLEKQNVEDWRELVDSIMIDFNYDGAVLEPAVIDIPERNGLVKGRYSIPEDAGTIHIKITDLLSESLEMEVKNG